MHGVVRISNKEPHGQNPQCCVKTVFVETGSDHWKARRRRRSETMGYDASLCQRKSSFLINRKPYCIAHAGLEALRLLEDK